ncbi:hypothetical protein OBBRIDRAFT_808640 [Obba rivulosa]|uniref:Uncharacterized protein n=1 Tax=Obba rivulosa TaxID=1052685 RepID=A0A8E2AL09_9APHY|nr:hypothetical protein OBBRIDRAFT_808640 [Obba rivulosa]
MSSAIDATRNSYAAALVASVAYGIYIVLAFQCIHRLWRKCAKSAILRKYVLLWSSIEFVDSQIDSAIFAAELSARLSILKDMIYTINIWVADSFMLYRASIIWGIDIIFGIPLLLFFRALGISIHPGIAYPKITWEISATGIGLLIETGKSEAAFRQISVTNFRMPFWLLSVATNVSATILIAGRLLWRRQALG